MRHVLEVAISESKNRRQNDSFVDEEDFWRDIFTMRFELWR